MCCKPSAQQRGFTLIEVVVTIIVISVAAAALLGVFGNLIRSSADPAIQQQAVTIAEAYMEEIRIKAFADPQNPAAETGGAETGETRATYDDVQDYNSLGTTQVRNQDDVAIAELSAYSVTVSVAAAALNTITAASGDALRITVTVNHPAIDPLSLVGYRADYP